ncbi:MAG: hypothetical protein M1817_000335 [Caeruleum heppii]|nr:MAG: hypothetical protein M1817_000335 [Caeruleum heppii]
MAPTTAANHVVVPVTDHSDGDPIKWPSDPVFTPIEPDFYLQKCGQMIMIDGGEAVQASHHQGSNMATLEDESAPDVYDTLVKKLAQQKVLDEKIEHRGSMDWRVNQQFIDENIKEIVEQYAFIPRKGEIVLFFRESTVGDYGFDPEDNMYFKLQDPKTENFTRAPRWEAGVVAQVAEEKIEPEDIFGNIQRKQYGVNYHGFRIEPIPDPGSSNKDESLRHIYVPLRQIRPFQYFKTFCAPVPMDNWHHTIHNAMKVAASVSLFCPARFKGTWPNADIYCKGIWIGPELMLIGDAIRLTNDQAVTPTKALAIGSIRLSMSDLDDPELAELSFYVRGKAYTRSPSEAYDDTRIEHDEVITHFPRGMWNYSWWPLHAPSKVYEVSVDQILGRCHELKGHFSFFPHEPEDDGAIASMRLAREYSKQHDTRNESADDWLWAEDRAEQLGIVTLSGRRIGRGDPLRRPNKWRRLLDTMDEVATGSANAQDELAGGMSSSWAAVNHPLGTAQQPELISSSSESATGDDRDELGGSSLHGHRSHHAGATDDEETGDTIQRLINGQIDPTLVATEQAEDESMTDVSDDSSPENQSGEKPSSEDDDVL